MQEKFVWMAVAAVLTIGALSWNAFSPVQTSLDNLRTLPARPLAKAAPGRALPAPTPAIPSLEDLPLAEQIQQLIATRDPEDEYKAYWLIRGCEYFNAEHDDMIFDLDEVTKNHNPLPLRGMNDSEKQHKVRLCSGMTERMRTSRFDYLADAAKAGVVGAVVQVAQEGPFGDRTALITRPDDPLVQEWKTAAKSALTKEADSGDLTALNYLWSHSLTGDELISKEPAMAYRYGVAQGLIYKDMDADPIIVNLYAPESQFMLSISDLSPEQRAVELAAAQHIADLARERRQHR